MSRRRPQVVIIGGGFGGLTAAAQLARAPVEVLLVDRLNHHMFQPMLYQVATGIESDGEVAPPLRGIFATANNVEVRLAEVTAMDLGARTVTAVAPDGDRLVLDYDYLIVAAGAGPSYLGHPEWERFAPGLKSIADAHRLRGRILGAFEMAADAVDPTERREWLTFVTVGAGPTGVEMTGQIAELSRRLLRREFKAIDTARTEIVLMDAGDAVLASFPRRLQRIARRDLERMGVRIELGMRVTDIDERGVEARDGNGRTSRVPARTVIWAAGVQASPLGRMLGEASGAEVDKRGRVAVGPDCSLPGHPEVFAVGDMVSLDQLPGVAQPAIQEAHHVARVIESRMAGTDPPGPFRYFDKGSMAMIGHHRAVVSAFGINFGGPLGALLWGVVHLRYLVGWGNRLGTIARWMWALFTRERRELCISDSGAISPTRGEHPAPAPPLSETVPADVHNRLDKVVVSVSGPDGGTESAPMHPRDARELADALRRAADTAEQTPSTPGKDS